MPEQPRPPANLAADGAEPLRWLLACEACRAQFDVSALGVGSRFHCQCGRMLEVPRRRSHDAAVVRCSSCGAPRGAGALQCGHCRADFTLHEQHRHTICPQCAGRIDDRASFCHACGIAITPQPAGTVSEIPCPSCGEGVDLLRRSLTHETPFVLHECARCAGVWLDAETFRHLEGTARTKSLPWVSTAAATPSSTAADRAKDWSYRKCPTCSAVMHRRNYGRKSGVVIDLCDAHGIWFDDRELERILVWIHDGGIERTRELLATDERPRKDPTTTPIVLDEMPSNVFERDVVTLAFDLVRRFFTGAR